MCFEVTIRFTINDNDKSGSSIKYPWANHQAWARYWCSEEKLHYWYNSVTGETEWEAWPWERHWCSEYEMYYWFNTRTGKSEWQDDHRIPDAACHHHKVEDEKEQEKDEQEDAEGEIW